MPKVKFQIQTAIANIQYSRNQAEYEMQIDGDEGSVEFMAAIKRQMEVTDAVFADIKVASHQTNSENIMLKSLVEKQEGQIQAYQIVVATATEKLGEEVVKDIIATASEKPEYQKNLSRSNID